MLKLNNIDKIYQNGSQMTHVLRRFGLEVAQGEIVSIIGPAGSGKSALLAIIGMIDEDWSGEYFFMDQHVHRLKPKERAELKRRNIGVVSQGNDLPENLSSAEILDISLEHRNMKRSARQALVAHTLERFDLESKKDLYPHQLSGGELQLLRIARATIADPRLILADEPTSNLHPERSAEVLEMFRELARSGTTIIQATHTQANRAFGERVVEMRNGQVVSDSRGAGHTADDGTVAGGIAVAS